MSVNFIWNQHSDDGRVLARKTQSHPRSPPSLYLSIPLTPARGNHSSDFICIDSFCRYLNLCILLFQMHVFPISYVLLHVAVKYFFRGNQISLRPQGSILYHHSDLIDLVYWGNQQDLLLRGSQIVLVYLHT